ncbi:hypothetical protein Hanom_Chr04g00353951 [Helianthus anomalus]
MVIKYAMNFNCGTTFKLYYNTKISTVVPPSKLHILLQEQFSMYLNSLSGPLKFQVYKHKTCIIHLTERK